MHPTAVVFDVGKVLYDWDPRFLYQKLITDPDQLDWFLGNVVTHAWHFQHDRGRPFAETSAELTAQFPDHAELIAAYGPRWLETIPGPLPGMIDLVDALAAADVPLFAITNFSAEFWERFRTTAPVFDHFRDVIVSGAERLTKPDPAIYALALRRFALAPGAGLFVDDRAENVAASVVAGFVGHHFTDAERLRGELQAYGLIASAAAPA